VASRRHPPPLGCHPGRANRGRAEGLPVPRRRQRSGIATLGPQNPGIFRCITVAEGKSIPRQYAHIIEACDVVIRGLARVGLVALVDEATGY
jgi:hypothetical protein